MALPPGITMAAVKPSGAYSLPIKPSPTYLFETTRLGFRCFTGADEVLVYQLNSHPQVLYYLHEVPVSPEQALATLHNSLLAQYRAYGYGRWAVYVKASHAFIGWCGLKYRPERKETDLGYRFLPEYWGQGYATEAARACIAYGFTHYHLARITARAHIENIASLKVLENCGMQYVQHETVEGVPVKLFEILP